MRSVLRGVSFVFCIKERLDHQGYSCKLKPHVSYLGLLPGCLPEYTSMMVSFVMICYFQSHFLLLFQLPALRQARSVRRFRRRRLVGVRAASVTASHLIKNLTVPEVRRIEPTPLRMDHYYYRLVVKRWILFTILRTICAYLIPFIRKDTSLS